MPRRNHVLATNEIYHVFNRSVGKEEILTLNSTLRRILALIDYYRYPQTIRFSRFKTLSEKQRQQYLMQVYNRQPLVEILTFSLMPNHYHFLLRQLQEQGIYTFISNIQNAFAKYFNVKYNRHGTLFQNAFKAKRVETEEELIHISRYVHLNPVTAFLIEIDQLASYPWTSYATYTRKHSYPFVTTDTLLSLFPSAEDYWKFVEDQVDYQRELSLIKNLIIE